MGGNHQLNDFLEWLIQRQQLEGEREETLFSIDDCEIDHTIG